MCVRLRAIEPTDIEMMYSLENDSELWAMGCTTVPYSRHALQQFIEQSAGDIYADRQVRLVIEADGEPVGCADLYDVDARNLRGEIAVAVLPQHRGHGIGQVAVRQLVDYASRHLGLHTLTCITAASNHALLSAARHAGFTECGTLRDWLRIDNSPHDAVILQFIPKK